MRMRRIALLGVLAVAAPVTGGTASSAAPPPCRIVTDPSGDEAYAPTHLPSLDIVSADLSSNATTLTGVVRVKNYDYANELGYRNYYLIFNVPYSHKVVFLDAAERIGDAAEPYYNFRFGLVEGSSGTTNDYVERSDPGVFGAVDATKGEIHVSVPLSALAKLGVTIKPKAPLTNIHAETVVVRGSFSKDIDVATTSRTYRASSPSCVKPGS
jgi:hypothetical protein